MFEILGLSCSLLSKQGRCRSEGNPLPAGLGAAAFPINPPLMRPRCAVMRDTRGGALERPRNEEWAGKQRTGPLTAPQKLLLWVHTGAPPDAP